jgi:dihydrofolate synthase/folylpolyglutamate synthase
VDASAAVGAELRLRGRDFDGVENADGTWTYRDGEGGLDRLPVPALAGAVQVGNAATALAALRSLRRRMPVERAAIEAGLREVRLAGRFQRIADARGFEWVLDVAHNPDSARTLAANLARYPVPGRTIAVCAMLADKDVAQVVGELAGRVERWIAAATDGPRGLSAEQLAWRAGDAGLDMTPCRSVGHAMRLAAAEARAGDRVVVFGSFHAAGPALVHLSKLHADGDPGPGSL